MTLPEKIKMLLEKRGMNQKDLADCSGLTEAAMTRYLNGERRPRSPAMSAIARVLDVPVDYLSEDIKINDDNEIKGMLMRGAPELNPDEFNELVNMLVDLSKKREGDNGKA